MSKQIGVLQLRRLCACEDVHLSRLSFYKTLTMLH
jgi:hypothetical protein